MSIWVVHWRENGKLRPSFKEYREVIENLCWKTRSKSHLKSDLTNICHIIRVPTVWRHCVIEH